MAISDQQIFDFFLGNPTDAQTFEAMKTFGISPQRIATATGTKVEDIIPRLTPFLPQNQAILLGDTWIQTQYRVDGSGESQQIGPLENIYISKTTGGVNDKQPVGTPVQVYSPEGRLVNTIKTKKDQSFFGGLVSALKDPVVLAALGGAAAGGLLSGAGTAATVGSTGLTTAQLAQLDLALGGAGGSAGASSLAGALTTGANVGTLTNLTGGSGATTGAQAGITAESVAKKLAEDAAAQAQAKIAADAIAADAAAQAKIAADAAAKATADAATKAAAAKASADAAIAKAAADAAAASKAAADIAAAKAAADATALASTSTTALGTGLMGTGGGLTVGGAGGLGGATGAIGLGGSLGSGLTTAGASGLGGATGAAGLGGSLGAGLTTASGLVGANTLLGGAGLGTSLLGTTGTGALTGTGVLTGSTLGTQLLGTGAGTAATVGGLGNTVANLGTGALTTGLEGLSSGLTGLGTGLTSGLSGLGTSLGTGLGTGLSGLGTGIGTGLTNAALANLLSTGLTTSAGLLQQQTSKEAAQRAQAMIDAETAAAKQSAAFRPIGMTTRFGTSQFVVDPVTGQLTSAGYTISPEAKNAQDRLVKLAESGLQQAEGAQVAFKPLQTGAESLFKLGAGYLAKTPEDVAKDYLASQMALLQPGRELELANLQNRLQQQGRGGLSVAQGGTMGATTPELQALYNARARQEAELAANAQQLGQRDVLFGSSLLGQGAQAMGQYYGGQQASYAPYTTALGQIQGLEQLAQQPFTMSQALAQQSAQAGANVGRLGLSGAEFSTRLATGPAATTNPYSTALSGLGASPAFGTVAGGLFSSLFS